MQNVCEIKKEQVILNEKAEFTCESAGNGDNERGTGVFLCLGHSARRSANWIKRYK